MSNCGIAGGDRPRPGPTQGEARSTASHRHGHPRMAPGRGDVSVDLPVDVVDGVRDWLAREPGEVTVARVAAAFRAMGRPVGDATVLAVHDHVRREVIGAGPLESLLRTPGVTDV